MRSRVQVLIVCLLLVSCGAQKVDVKTTAQRDPVSSSDTVQAEASFLDERNAKKRTAMQRHTLVHDGLTREYFMFEPSHDSKNPRGWPLLIFLHGYGGTATGTEAETTNGLNRYAAKFGYAVVYPQGTWFETQGNGRVSIITSWNDLAGNRDEGPLGPLCAADAPRYPCPSECGDCGRCGWASCHDDVGFLTKLIAHLRRSDRINSNNLFIAGFSNGSMMAHRMACLQSDNLTAAALIGGRLELGYSCAPDEVLPLLQLNGMKDSVVPYEGKRPGSSFYYTSVAQVHTDWAAANDCTQPLTPWSGHQIMVDASADALQLTCSSQCVGTGRELLNCLWVEGTHVWPGYPAGHGSGGYCAGAEQIIGMPGATLCVEPVTNTNVWGSQLMFEFFERHRK